MCASIAMPARTSESRYSVRLEVGASRTRRRAQNPMEARLQQPTGAHDERPNATLTADERRQKKDRKRALKEQHRTDRAQRRVRNTEAWAQDHRQAQVSRQSNDGGAAAVPTVALKDDMGRVYSHAPADIVAVARSRLGRFMQSFLDEPVYVAARTKHQAKALELLDKMKKGRQTAEDFGDPGALWGYAKYKWSARAMLTFEAFRQAHCSGFLAAGPGVPVDGTVVAIGGGPGNDIFGFELCREFVFSHTGDMGGVDADESSTVASQTMGRRIVFDLCAEAWAPLVAKAGDLLSCPAECCSCDLSQPLTHRANRRLHETAGTAAVFLFSYVLQEVGALGCWRSCVTSLWEAASVGALFYVKDPNDRTAHQVLQLLGAEEDAWQEATDYCWVCGDALLVRKSDRLSRRLRSKVDAPSE